MARTDIDYINGVNNDMSVCSDSENKYFDVSVHNIKEIKYSGWRKGSTYKVRTIEIVTLNGTVDINLFKDKGSK